MTNEEILVACVRAELGDSIGDQFRTWLDYPDDEDLNPNAIRAAARIVTKVALGPSDLSAAAADVRDTLSEYGYGSAKAPMI